MTGRVGRSGEAHLAGGGCQEGADWVSAPTLRGPVVAGVSGKVAEAVTLGLLATLVPRLLGPADYGHFAVALTVVALGSLAMTMGGATLLARYVPAAADPPAVAAALTRRLARNRAAVFAGLVAAGAAAAALAPGPFPPVETAVVLAALGLNVVATLALQADLGLGHAGAWSFRYPLQNAVLVAAVLALHPLTGATGAVAAIGVSAAVAAVLGLAVAAPLLRAGRRPAVIPDGALRFGVLQAASGVLAQVTQRGGVIVVALLAGSAAQTGYAGLAVGIALAATYAVVQVFTVTLPALAARTGDGSQPVTAGSEPTLRRLASLLLVAVLTVAVAAVATLDVTVPAVFGPGYAAAVPAFGPALAAVVLAPLNALAVQAAALRLQPGATVRAGVVGLVAFVAVAIATVPAWGAAGATAAALAGAAGSGLASIRLLPGAVGARLAILSFGGAAAVCLLGVL